MTPEQLQTLKDSPKAWEKWKDDVIIEQKAREGNTGQKAARVRFIEDFMWDRLKKSPHLVIDWLWKEHQIHAGVYALTDDNATITMFQAMTRCKVYQDTPPDFSSDPRIKEDPAEARSAGIVKGFQILEERLK